MNYPHLPPKEGDDPEFFLDLAEQVFSQLTLEQRFIRLLPQSDLSLEQSAKLIHAMAREHYAPLLKDLPDVIQAEMLIKPYAPFYWRLTLAFDGRTFDYYFPTYVESKTAHQEQLDHDFLLRLFQEMFDTFRERADFPDLPDSPGYERYPGNTLEESERFFAVIDYLQPQVKTLLGEEVYQRLFESESDIPGILIRAEHPQKESEQ